MSGGGWAKQDGEMESVHSRSFFFVVLGRKGGGKQEGGNVRRVKAEGVV